MTAWTAWSLGDTLACGYKLRYLDFFLTRIIDFDEFK